MSESAVYFGAGKPGERSGKISFKEKLGRGFTFTGAEKAWREKHAKEIQELTAIHNALSEEDRKVAAAKLDQDISRKAHNIVYKNYALATAVTLAAVGETLLIAKPGWAKGVEHFQVTIFGKPRKIFKPIGAQARIAHDGLVAIVNKVKGLRHDTDNVESPKINETPSPVTEPTRPMSEANLLLQKTHTDIAAREAAEQEFAATINELLQSPKAQALPSDIDPGFLPEEKLALGHEWGRLEQYWRHGHKLEKPKYDQLVYLFHFQDLNAINNAMPVLQDKSPFIRIKFKEIGDPFLSDEAKHRLRDYFDTCRNKGKWLPMFEDGLDILFTGGRKFNHWEVGDLIQEGLFKKHDFMGGGSAIVITKKGVEFILKHLQSLKP